MAQALTRRAGFVCQSCQFKQLSKTAARPLSSIAFTPLPSQPAKSRKNVHNSGLERRTAATAVRAVRKPSPTRAARTQDKFIVKEHTSVSDPPAVLTALRRDVSHIISSKTLPTEAEVLELLERIFQFSNIIIFGQPEQPDVEENPSSEKRNPSSSILTDLDEAQANLQRHTISAARAGSLSLSFRTKAAETLCDLAYNLVRDPKVTIHEEVLQIYVRIQCLLGRPQYLPEIFHLYAHKPTPTQKGSSITYTNTTPWHPRYDIPLDLSDAALHAAIATKDLPLAIAIIDTTVGTTNHKLMRLFRKASLPLAGVATTPVIAYAGASWVSTFQNVWDDEMAKWTALAGSAAYIGTLGTIGFVAVTTWNDHMQRVVWQPGTGLWDRWIREDERLYLDRIALAWGFQEKWRRGEEQGGEWESLREVCGLRSMVLDKTDLMQGMQ